MTNDPHLPVSPPPHSPLPSEVERLTGHGQVHRDGVLLLETDYDITIAPRSQSAGPDTAHSAAASAEHDITGRLIGPFYTAEHLLGRHSLVLEDGREFDFRVIQPDTNEIVAISSLRFPVKWRAGASPDTLER